MRTGCRSKLNDRGGSPAAGPSFLPSQVSFLGRVRAPAGRSQPPVNQRWQAQGPQNPPNGGEPLPVTGRQLGIGRHAMDDPAVYLRYQYCNHRPTEEAGNGHEAAEHSKRPAPRWVRRRWPDQAAGRTSLGGAPSLPVCGVGSRSRSSHVRLDERPASSHSIPRQLTHRPHNVRRLRQDIILEGR